MELSPVPAGFRELPGADRIAIVIQRVCPGTPRWPWIHVRLNRKNGDNVRHAQLTVSTGLLFKRNAPGRGYVGPRPDVRLHASCITVVARGPYFDLAYAVTSTRQLVRRFEQWERKASLKRAVALRP